MMKNNAWYSVDRLTNILSIGERTIQQWVERDKVSEAHYRYVRGKGRGGRQLEICAAGVPDKYQSTLLEYLAGKDTGADATRIDAALYGNLSGWQQQHVDRWLDRLDRFAGLKGKALGKAITIYKQKHPGEKLSRSNYYKVRREYDRMGLASLVPGWGNREGENEINDADYRLFKEYYLKESKPSAASCWELVRGAAYRAGREVADFPHPKSFKRRVQKEVPEQAIYYARHGEAAWKRKYANYADRDKSMIPAGSCWVSDHRQLDVFVKDPADGKLYRPWLTAWMDFKSGKWLSWLLHRDAPNSDHLFMTTKWAIEAFGLCDDIYIDNGKDYRARDFAGGRSHHNVRVDEVHSRAMMTMLGIKTHFAIPYNAQAKNIERAFRGFIEYLEKHLPGYTGSNAAARPEATKQRAKKGEAMDAEKFEELFNGFIENKLNKKPGRGKELKGRSPNELFYAEHTEKKVPRPEALKLLCMRTSGDVTIGRNGAKDSSVGRRYWADWMSAYKGTKVYLRRDIAQYEIAWVFDAQTDRSLGMARDDQRIHALADDHLTKKQLRNKQAQKRRDKKIAKQYSESLERPPVEETFANAIANEQATEELRRENGDYKEYDEDQKVVRMANTYADKEVERRRKLSEMRTGDNEIPDVPEPKQAKPLKGLFDEDEDEEWEILEASG